ncbi:MAG: branched-chain amino acid aminotransferase [Candidatus Dormibacteria bacterium]|jgi:branched-chain amino acid aminotransferase
MTFSVQPGVGVARGRRDAILAAPGFGQAFSDHMVTMKWTAELGWHDGALTPHVPLSLAPGSTVFHNGQGVFEGFKAYRQADGGVAMFRPDANAARFARSAQRLALPALPTEDFLAAADLLVRTDVAWLPDGEEMSLYLRPFMFGTTVGLTVRPATDVTFVLIASPVGAYFASGPKPLSMWVSEKFSRAAPGGTGAAKFSGNYAGSLVSVQEAFDHGCDQVVFLDVLEHRWVEELGGMNLFFVFDDGTLVTPELTGTILEGVTRDSLLTLAAAHGYEAVERRISIDEWRDGIRDSRITEVFACGTAAVITPIRQLKWAGGTVSTPTEGIGPCAARLRSALLDIQYGRAGDQHGWMRRVVTNDRSPSAQG